MFSIRNSAILAVAWSVSGLAWQGAPPVSAAEPFYAGKTVKVIIRSGPGGGYDFYGRLIARHMPKYLPGNPETIPVNMPGAGGIIAANYLANRAKRDGTEIGIPNRELAIAQRTGVKGIKYDVRTLIPIGSAAASTAVFLLRKDHPVDSLKELKTYDKVVRFSTTGAGGGTYQRVMLLKLAGYPVQPITGYQGIQERILAVIRGDLEGSSNSLESTPPDAMKDLKLLGFLGNRTEDLKDADDVRTMLDRKNRQLAALLVAPMTAGRPFFTTPGVPADRVALLRAAFRKALADPEAKAEAKRADRAISWTDPKTMEEIYRDILDADDEVIARFKKLL